MTKVDHSAKVSGFGGRLRRLPFVLALTLGLLLSLMHCANCGLAFANADSSAVTMTNDTSTPPDLPDEQLPAHSGHCLSHVTAQSVMVTTSPADLPLRAPVFAGDQTPASLAGLPLFKPPRV